MTSAEAARDVALTLAAMSLEHAFREPWPNLARRALQVDGPGLEELAMLGAALFIDYVRLARGEISAVHVPRRLPRRGETPRASWELLLALAPRIPPIQPTPQRTEFIDLAAIRAAINGCNID